MPTQVTPEWLSTRPLPQYGENIDKEDRGRILVFAGSREIPGAALLAGVAALRAGAGKLVVATVESVAQGLSLAIPEARVVALPETTGGEIAERAIDVLRPLVEQTAAVVAGPGLADNGAGRDLFRHVLASCSDCSVVVDAAALAALDSIAGSERIVATPHPGELAHLTGESKDAICTDRVAAAQRAAQRFRVIVALKGSTTVVATPSGETFVHESTSPGLATSGSGDVLAGVIGGIAARRTGALDAALWGIALHAAAGARLDERIAPLGYLARELSAEIPALMAAFGRHDEAPASSGRQQSSAAQADVERRGGR